MSHRDPFFCIVPSYMLENIMENGTSEQRQYAMNNLAHSVAVRERRAARPTAVPATAVGRTASMPSKNRIIYSAAEQNILPGQQVRSEGEPPTGDLSVDEAYAGAGATYDLFEQVYDHISVDGHGLRLDSTVHYRVGYDNAFWNGRQMVYGDGDEDLPEGQRLFNRFTVALDIIGHELVHGVTQFSAGLVYEGQAGALNEAFSDIFGSLVKQWKLGQTAVEADWLIGAELLTKNVNGEALRSLKAPGTAYDDRVLGKDPQPAHMDQYIVTTDDHGGVHVNSGIPNHAFYVAAIKMGGSAWEKAGRIWYTVLQSKLGTRATFQDAADATHQAAADLYGTNSLEQEAVYNGWTAVGITPAPTIPVTPPPPLPSENTAMGCRPTLKSLLFLLR